MRGAHARGPLAFGLMTLLGVAPPGAQAACPRFAPALQGLPTAGEWRTHPALGDVDGDGHPDVAGNPRKGTGPGAWFGDGAGRWRERSAGLVVPGISCGIGVDLADVDADGDLDLGIADHCQGIHVYAYERGAWRLLADPSRHRLQGGFDDLQFGDLTGDGHVDLVATGAMTGGFGVLQGDGRGNWTPLQTNLPRHGYAPDVKLADLDADGDMDVAAAFTSDEPGPVRTLPRHPAVWLNEGGGRFLLHAAGLPEEGDFRGVALGDVDGDGLLDLALSAGTWPGRPALLVYLGARAPGAWRAAPGGHPESAASEVFEGVELADLDGDGVLDVVAVSHPDAGLHVWRGQGAGRFERCADTGLPSGREAVRGWGLAVADVDGDRRPDVAYGYGRAAKGALEVWVQTGQP